jgi:hypothetical protein
MDEVIAWLLWYNRARLHPTLPHVSPMQFEQSWRAGHPARQRMNSITGYGLKGQGHDSGIQAGCARLKTKMSEDPWQRSSS